MLGVDGCGKSTQARLLVAWLNGNGVRAAYFDNAGGRPVLDRLGRAAAR
jgi:dTMP kinase